MQVSEEGRIENNSENRNIYYAAYMSKPKEMETGILSTGNGNPSLKFDVV